MTDTERLYRLLKQEGSRGVHTAEIRRQGFSGNPSQRATEIEAKYGVQIDRQTEFRNGRNGKRFRIVQNAGSSARGAEESGPQPIEASEVPTSLRTHGASVASGALEDDSDAQISLPTEPETLAQPSGRPSSMYDAFSEFS